MTTSPVPVHHAVPMTIHTFARQTGPVVLAGADHGGGAVYWITGWIVVLALIVGAVVYFTRRGHRHAEPGNPAYGQPPSHRRVSDDQPDDRSR